MQFETLIVVGCHAHAPVEAAASLRQAATDNKIAYMQVREVNQNSKSFLVNLE